MTCARSELHYSIHQLIIIAIVYSVIVMKRLCNQYNNIFRSNIYHPAITNLFLSEVDSLRLLLCDWFSLWVVRVGWAVSSKDEQDTVLRILLNWRRVGERRIFCGDGDANSIRRMNKILKFNISLRNIAIELFVLWNRNYNFLNNKVTMCTGS